MSGPAASTASELLLAKAVGRRFGLVPSVHDVPTTRCDIPGVHHAVAPRFGARAWSSPSGGVGWTPQAARRAATGEALERYAAAVAPLPAAPRPGRRVVDLDDFSLYSPGQRRSPAFPHRQVFDEFAAGGGTYADVLDATGEPWWVPRFLVGLGDTAGHGLSTSSGLAAGSSLSMARLRATQEVVERDALMTTWLHGVPARRCPVPTVLGELAANRSGRLVVLDATPAYSPHPVALVGGWVPQRGRRRIALGAACRATWAEAVDKAFLEWCQGVLFAGVYLEINPDLRLTHTSDVTTFEHHAAFYTLNPKRWDELPFLRGAVAASPSPSPASDRDAADQLDELLTILAGNGVRLFWRDLSTVDTRQVGVHVVRVLSPDLTPIHCDEAWPHLGGRSADLGWRYPWAAKLGHGYPNPAPHPLG